jgi:DNA-binding SARP family transcriptional activator
VTRDRLAQLAHGLGGFVALLLLVVGIPAALALGVGWPLPHAVPTLSGLHRLFGGRYHPTSSFYLRVVALVAWIAWLEVATCAAAEVRAAISGRRPWRVRFAGPIQPLIASLVAVVVLALPPSGEAPAHTPSLAVALTASAPARRSLLVADKLDGPTTRPVTESHSRPRHHPEHPESIKVTVGPRDTLWDLAEQYLGNPLDWRQIFDLNVGKPQPTGGELTDPSVIRVGWVLELPPRAATRVFPEHHGDRPPKRAHAGTAPTSRPVPAHRVPAPPHSTNGNGKQPRRPVHWRPHPSEPTHHGPSRPAPTAEPSSGPLVELPTGAVVSTSFLAGVAAAVALGRLRRRRLYRPRPPTAGWSGRGWEPPPPLKAMLAAGRARQTDEVEADEASEEGREPEPVDRDLYVPLGRVMIGRQGDQPLLVEIASGGLGIDGPGAESVGRAVVTDIVTRHLPGQLECVVESDLWHDLVGEADPFPGLRRVSTVDEFLREAEVELIRRVRVLEDEDLDHLDAYWTAHPEDPMPILLLVCPRPGTGLEGRIAGVLGLGGRIGIGALVLGSGSGLKTSIVVGDDGRVRQTSAPEFESAQLVHLAVDETEAALQAVAAIRRTDDEAVNTEPDIVETGEDRRTLDVPKSSTDAPVRVELLGSFRILVGGDEVRSGMRMKARELLAWFCCHPEGGTTEAVVEALWPGVDPNKVSQRFWNSVTNLRGRLREVTGLPELRLLDRYGTRYRLVEGELSVDLWKVENVIGRVANVPCDAARDPRLDREVAMYTGALLEDCDWLWAEALREDLRSRILDILVRLAEDHEQSGRLAEALGLLEQAIVIDPYAEELYRKAIVLRQRSGHRDGARRTLAELTTRLDELGLDPQEETVQLARGLRSSSVG